MQVANQESSTLTKLFPILDNKGVNIKKEIMAGLTTFLTMAYIIAVNPNILSQSGMPAGALVTGTCLAAAVGCFIMGIIANLPFALASGMGKASLYHQYAGMSSEHLHFLPLLPRQELRLLRHRRVRMLHGLYNLPKKTFYQHR